MRIMIAGTHSGCGKTTITLALMAALRAEGLTVAPFKVGPDYIDTGFHQVACGRASNNLDAHLLDWETIEYLLYNYGRTADISVIEGVMGFYDGRDAVSLECSSYELARRTRTPVLLVVDAAGGAASVAAQVLGFNSLAPDNTIAGVIVNRASSQRHYQLVKDAVTHYTDIPCVGWLKQDGELHLNSRHLGLIPAEELPEINAQLARAAELARAGMDMALLRCIAATAPAIKPRACRMTRWLAAHENIFGGMKIGVPRDAAFSFYYQANLDALRRAGAELVSFSPLEAAALPEGLDALYIGGGFPEVFAAQLGSNAHMLSSVKNALAGGLKCYAECGGLIYLSESVDGHNMVGYLPLKCEMTDRLQRFGYVRVHDETGMEFPAHEFHHALARPSGAEIHCAYDVARPDGGATWQCGYTKGNTLAGFPHIHFWSNPDAMPRLLGR